jgi:hypothetical protein
VRELLTRPRDIIIIREQDLVYLLPVFSIRLIGTIFFSTSQSLLHVIRDAFCHPNLRLTSLSLGCMRVEFLFACKGIMASLADTRVASIKVFSSSCQNDALEMGLISRYILLHPRDFIPRGECTRSPTIFYWIMHAKRADEPRYRFLELL